VLYRLSSIRYAKWSIQSMILRLSQDVVFENGSGGRDYTTHTLRQSHQVPSLGSNIQYHGRYKRMENTTWVEALTYGSGCRGHRYCSAFWLFVCFVSLRSKRVDWADDLRELDISRRYLVVRNLCLAIPKRRCVLVSVTTRQNTLDILRSSLSIKPLKINAFTLASLSASKSVPPDR